MTSSADIRIKRIYAAAEDSDGIRILVDRLWPRGISRERAALTCWAKELAPSTELRKWFGHDPKKWPEFQRRYRKELQATKDWLTEIRALSGKDRVTLLFAARDEEHNEAVILRDLLLES